MIVWFSLPNILFSSLFAAGDVSHETSPATKSEEKRMVSQGKFDLAGLFRFVNFTENIGLPVI